jgi:NAD(P)-dependent dehydrogenase (short-subunit alcohol dehydrogenase family)
VSGFRVPDQRGQRYLVTRASSGVGRALATALTSGGARVIRARRGEMPALDLASLGAVREFAASIDGEIDVLINNAGVMGASRARRRSMGSRPTSASISSERLP